MYLDKESFNGPKDWGVPGRLLRTGLWCNGNTTVFGAVFLGSSPSKPTKK